MANTPTKEHDNEAVRIWNTIVSGGTIGTLAQALCDAEQRGRDAELAEVTSWIAAELGDSGDQLLIDLNMGKHRAKGGK